MADSVSRSAGRVSTLELFFDIVFVFTITQVTFIVEHHPSWETAAQALVELTVIYWMYGGFAWLTNALGSKTQRQRTVLLLGMAAFAVVSLAVPDAFGHDGVAFGYAYLLLNVVHLAGFLIGGVPSAAATMRRLGAVNLSASGLLLAAGYLGGHWHWPLWVAAVLLQWGFALGTRAGGGIAIDAEHFAERHGLMVIIVLGESLVSVALAAHGQPVTLRVAVGLLCGLAASAAMWWCYFAGDDDAAARVFGQRAVADRGSSALLGYDLPHVLMLAGVVAVAAGSRLSSPELTEPTELTAAALLAGGVATYLAGLGVFRLIIGFANPVPRLVAGGAVLATVPAGTSLGAAQQLLLLTLLLVVLLLAERVLGARGTAPMPDQAGCGP